MPFAGAFALDNLQKYAEMLRQRKLLAEKTAFERMQAQDVMRRGQEGLDLQRRNQDLNESLRRDTLESNDRLRRDTLDAQSFDREAKRVEAVDENAMAGDPISDELAALMQKHGRGGSIRTKSLSIPEVALTGPDSINKGALRTVGAAESRDFREHRGGSKYQSAQQLRAQQDAAAAARATDAAKARMEQVEFQGGIQRDIAEGRNSTAAMIAAMNNAGRAERDADKKAEAVKQQGQSRNLALQAIDQDLDRLNALGTFDPRSGAFQGLKPEVAGLYGASTGRITKYYPGSAGAAAEASLNQITADAVVNTILEMKAQSRTGATGFGQLNIKELDIIQSAATKLKDRNIPPDVAAAELKEMIRRLNTMRSIIAGGGGVTPTPSQGSGGSGFRVVGSRPK